MKPKTIEYWPKNGAVELQLGSPKYGQIRFQPGSNKLDAHMFESLSEQANFQARIADGTLRVVEPVVKATSPKVRQVEQKPQSAEPPQPIEPLPSTAKEAIDAWEAMVAASDSASGGQVSQEQLLVTAQAWLIGSSWVTLNRVLTEWLEEKGAL